MKTCPKCGAKMEADVNFCTECGTDIRNVPVEEVEITQTVTRSEESVAQTNAPKRSEQATEKIDSQSQVAGLGQDFAQSMKSFDVNNMWQWFVNSWKHPFAEQNADKWYGWITLLAEDILVALGLFIGSQRATSSILGQDFAGSTSRFTFGMALELIFFLLLTQAAWIGAAYLSYKVIYNQNKNFLQLTNHIVQTSNLSAIFIVVYFVFMLLAGPGGVVMSTIMIWLSVALFGMALTVVVVGDPNPVHDKLYGYLLFLVLQFITGAIMTILIFSTVLGQFGSALHLY
ncbi:zinc ribbon domain-containing protein [Lactobacillus agrestimuris]|uniref:zinc ribbon domain-containing protein n=1 Tax=Lactobacillus agrestimuris TaxID=2941328 RepID=UPI002044C9A6|nr:zinc ribbon domain-containing protein [Lactobacillus agrestimuris]